MILNHFGLIKMIKKKTTFLTLQFSWSIFERFDKHPDLLTISIKQRWRHFRKRFCSWNDCLRLNYYYLSMFQKLRWSYTYYSQVKSCTKKANPITCSIKDSESRLNSSQLAKLEKSIPPWNLLGIRSWAKKFKYLKNHDFL